MKLSKELSAEELFAWAVRKLGGRAISTGELRTSLVARARDNKDVEGVLARLKDFGYLNDARFAESFAAARLDNDGLGKSRVLRDLRRRRVAPDVAERMVTKVYAGQDEITLIEQYIRRKFRAAGGRSLFQTDRELASAYGRLVRAGFTSSNSLRVLKQFAADPGRLDEMEIPPPETEEEL